ncbi:unnamed protein product [Durusdinium trenchii]|uniref:RRM domain-containing protein n=1 Tax=Durusdinium trenchii TaxID=1381693 RepID=A0ABP0Q360_9DINO
MDWQAEWALYHLARLDEHFAERLGIAEETEGNLEPPTDWALELRTALHVEGELLHLDKGLLRFLLRDLLYRDEHVCDLGAFAGHYSLWLNDTGLVTSFAFDAVTAVTASVRPMDLTEEGAAAELPIRCAVVLCLEVLEHIPRHQEEVALKNLGRLAGRALVLSWAPPHIPGPGHINQRPTLDAWARVEEVTGLQRSHELTEEAQARSEIPWIRESVAIFFRVPGATCLVYLGDAALAQMAVQVLQGYSLRRHSLNFMAAAVPQGSGTIFVGNLPSEADELSLHELFSSQAAVADIRLVRHETVCFGFVDFKTHHDAMKALEELQGVKYLGRALRLDEQQVRPNFTPVLSRCPPARERGETKLKRHGPDARKLFVGGISPEIKEEEVQQSLEALKGATEVSIHQNKNKLGSYAFVWFSTPELAEEAMQKRLVVCAGQKFHLERTMKKKRGTADRSHGVWFARGRPAAGAAGGLRLSGKRG